MKIVSYWMSDKLSKTVITATKYTKKGYTVKQPKTATGLFGKAIQYNITCPFPFVPLWYIWKFWDVRFVGFGIRER